MWQVQGQPGIHETQSPNKEKLKKKLTSFLSDTNIKNIYFINKKLNYAFC